MHYSVWVNTHTCTKTSHVDTGCHFFSFSEGKHANMNSQPDNGHQQQSGNGCSRQGPTQNRKPQPADGLETQALPMPIPDPPIQYTKVSCTKHQESKKSRLSQAWGMIWAPAHRGQFSYCRYIDFYIIHQKDTQDLRILLEDKWSSVGMYWV